MECFLYGLCLWLEIVHNNKSEPEILGLYVFVNLIFSVTVFYWSKHGFFFYQGYFNRNGRNKQEWKDFVET